MCVSKVQHITGRKTGCNRSSPVFFGFRFFDKRRNWQPKNFRICATTTGGLVFCSWVQSDFGLFSSPANWNCKHYQPVTTATSTAHKWPPATMCEDNSSTGSNVRERIRRTVCWTGERPTVMYPSFPGTMQCFDLPSTTSCLRCILVNNGMDTL